MRGIRTIALLSCLLMAGCEKELRSVSVPPLVAFGDTSGVVVPMGETTEVEILLTRGLEEPTDLPFAIDLFGIDPAAVDLPASPLPVPAGNTEVYLPIALVDPDAPDLVLAEGTITLLPTDSTQLRLSERNRFRFVFGQRHTVDVYRWVPRSAFPQLYGYTSFDEDPVPLTGRGPSAGEHFVLAYASRTEPNVIGFVNPIPGDGTNALNMNRIYADEDVSSNSNINIPKLFRLQPDGEEASRGTVEVIPQQVTIQRRTTSGRPPFEIGISGEGTYDEVSGVIEFEVVFDETGIGGPPAVLRNYRYESQRRE